MGKITVKHYLNKKVSPRFDGKTATYPLYVQITADRTTYRMRSDFFLRNGYLSEGELNSAIVELFLASEKKRLERAVNFLISNKDFAVLNAAWIRKLSIRLIDYLDNELIKLFEKEFEEEEGYALPDAVSRLEFSEFLELYNCLKSEVDYNFSSAYNSLKVTFQAIENYRGDIDREFLVLDLFTDRSEDLKKIINTYADLGLYDEDEDENEYDKVIKGLKIFILNN